jgi:ankyrin repeat protein
MTNRGANAFALDLTHEQRRSWNSLNQPPYDAFRNSFKLAKPQSGTLDWLVEKFDNSAHTYQCEDAHARTLSNKEFVTWRDSDTSAPLLVVAPPGRGKSVLSNYVLGHLESLAHYNTTATTKTIYYFCNIKNDETAWNARSLLRALIVQLCECQQRLFDLLLTEYKTRSESFLNAPFDTLWHIFEQMLQDEAYGRINCIIDGLDVYQDGMDELIDKLFATVPRLRARKGPVLKFFCTSRSGTHLNKWPFKYQVVLRCNPKDLDCFINSQISDLGQGFTVEMRHMIRRECSAQTKEDKTFLWLEVVFRRFKMITLPNIQRIKDTIRKSSLDLFKLYENLIHEFREDTDVLRLLAWVAYAKERMSLASLEDAMAVHLEDQCTSLQSRKLKRAHLTVEEIFKACGTMLDVIEDKVYFIHQSVQDYFDEEDPLRSFIGVSPRLVPAYACFAYLASEDFHQQRNDLEKFPFLGYAQRCWHLHIESTADITNSDGLQDLLVRLIAPIQLETWSYRIELLRSLDYRIWAQGSLRDGEAEFSPSLASDIALHYDIGWMVKLILDRSIAGLPNDFSKDYLSRAARGRGCVLRALLEHESSVIFPLESQMIRFVAKNRDDTVFELLLRKRGQDVRIDSDVAAAAAANPHHAIEIMELLLQNGGDGIRFTSDLLEIAARNENSGKRLLELLFDQKGHEVHITNRVLEAAAGNYSSGDSILELLVRKMGEKTKITQNVVKVASGNWWSGNEERQNEAHVTATALAATAKDDIDGGTILALPSNDQQQHTARLCITDDIVRAAANNCECGLNIMKLLLYWQPKEVHITMQALVAIERNWTQGRRILMLLLKQRADDTHVTRDIAERILERFAIDVMRLIYERRSNSHYMSQHVIRLLAKNLVYLAVLTNNLHDLRILLALGADADFVSDDGWTPLTVAAERGDLSTIKVLLAHKAELPFSPTINPSPLNLAALCGHLDVVRLLLDKGPSTLPESQAYINATDGDGRTPLASASLYGHFRVAELLIEHDANIAISDNYGFTPLCIAATYGCFEVVELLTKLLLDKGCNINTSHDDGETPLSMAASNGHLKVVKHIVKLLHEQGTDISGSVNDKNTPLKGASSWGHLDTVEFLLSQGANPMIFNKDGGSPLDLAAEHGYVEIVKALLTHESFDTIDNKYSLCGTIANTLAYMGQTDLLLYIVLHKKSNLDSADGLNRTTLLFAARGGHVETFEYLVGHGLPLDTRDAKRDGLISYAASSGNPQLLDTVLRHELEFNPQTGHWSPLHWACRSGDIHTVIKVVEMARAKGWQSGPIVVVDVEGELTREWTPQAIAMFHGNREMVENLSQTDRAALGSQNAIVDVEGNRHDILCDFCFHVSKQLVTYWKILTLNRTSTDHDSDAVRALGLTAASCANLIWETHMKLLTSGSVYFVV